MQINPVNNQKNLLSVIVPVYNVEKYIGKCISSILNQTFTKFELLLINDGSFDSSPTICDSFALTDSRVKVFHQDNSGVSAARNRGILESTTKYICFIDSDDWIDSTYLANFFYKDISDNTLVIQGMTIEYTDGRQKYMSFENRNYTYSEVGECVIEQDILNYGSPCGKLYVTNIVKSNNILFLDNLSYGEDTLFFLDYIRYIDGLGMLSFVNYHYRYSYNGNSLSRKKHHPFMLLLFYNKYYNNVLFLNEKFAISNKLFIYNTEAFYFRGLVRAFLNIDENRFTIAEINLLRQEIIDKISKLNHLNFTNCILRYIISLVPWKLLLKFSHCYK